MSKHTPGPWFMTKGLPGYRSRINSTPQNLGWDLAHVCNGPEADANARLIAAAPDLLEALQLMVDRFIDTEGSFGAWENEAIEAASAAIEKATGGEG